MEEREAGTSGVRLTHVVLGCGNFGGIGSAPELFGQGESPEEAVAIMDAAWNLGITSFDTADAYGGGRSETAIGDWMRQTGYTPTLTTKTYNPMQAGADHGLAPSRIVRQLESSLERLRVDVVDLYLAHDFDPDTPIEETVAAFEGLKEVGLIRAYGFSNFNAEQLRRTLLLGAKPALVQNSYSLLDRRDEWDVIPLCVEFGVGYEAYSPLAGGWLTGKYRRGEAPPPGSRMAVRGEGYAHLQNERVFAALDAFERSAAERGTDMASLAFAWLLAQEHVTAAIVGPRRPEQLAPAIDALSLQLSPDEAQGIAEIFP